MQKSKSRLTRACLCLIPCLGWFRGNQKRTPVAWVPILKQTVNPSPKFAGPEAKRNRTAGCQPSAVHPRVRTVPTSADLGIAFDVRAHAHTRVRVCVCVCVCV